MGKKSYITFIMSAALFMSGCAQSAADYEKAAENAASKGDTQKAIENYQKAIEKDSKNSTAYIGLADIYQQNDQMDEAVQTLQSGIDADPSENPGLYVTLANVYSTLGDTEKYKNTLEKGYSTVSDQKTFQEEAGKNASTVIWTVAPKYDYKDIKEVTSTFSDGYYGLSTYRQDIVAATNDGKTYGIVDYQGNVLTEMLYDQMDEYGANGYLMDSVLDCVKPNNTRYRYEYDTKMNMKQIDYLGTGGTGLPAKIYYRNDGMIVLDQYEGFTQTSQHSETTKDAVEYYSYFKDTAYHVVTCYEDHNKSVVLQNGKVITTANHPAMYAQAAGYSPYNNGIGIYADKACAAVPKVHVGSGVYYENYLLYGCKVEENLDMRTNVTAKYGYYDSEGKDITDALYDTAYFFTDGYAAVARDGKAGYIDSTGKEAIPMIFDKTLALYQGKGWVCVNGKWGVIDLANTVKYGILANEQTTAMK